MKQQCSPPKRNIIRFLLRLRLHCDVVFRSPRAYLEAVWWRLTNKRVRARAHFARLFAVSPHAYPLWRLAEVPPDPAAGRELPGMLVALVDATNATGDLEGTLQSLNSEGVAALVIGHGHLATAADAVGMIDWAASPWLMPIVAGDRLAGGAGSQYRLAIATGQSRIIYADDDLLGKRERRVSPHFKPAWNSELFKHFDYLTGSCIVHAGTPLLARLTNAGWAAELVGACLEYGAPVHIAQILHHRQSRPAPARPASAVEHIEVWPRTSVIIPTRNRVDLLQKCIAGLEATDYPAFEVLIVDNGSDDPATLSYFNNLERGRYQVMRQPGPFNFSALNNRAAQAASGEFLCLLNNDVEMLETDWLKYLVRQGRRDDVGAVGARLLYPDGRIQHAGVILGIGGAAAHGHRLIHPSEDGYFHRHALPQFVSAVTAACLVVKRERFLAVGGLDEVNFPVAFNDVDLCLRLNQQGWQSMYEPRATLIHHESVSRGLDRDPVGAARFSSELAALRSTWSTQGVIDPFHHPQLSPFSEKFGVRI